MTTASDRTSDFRRLLLLASLWAASRLAVLLAFCLSPTLPVALGQSPASVRAGLSQWDAGWLLGIAEKGYQQVHETAFFPGFPFAIRLVALASGDLLASAEILNATLSLGACLLLYLLVRRTRSADEAIAAACILLFHPLSFFFSIPYTEALFLLLVLGTFVAVAKNQWLWVALCSAAAALTRNTGVLLAAPLLYGALRQGSGSGRDSDRYRATAAAFAPVLALAGYGLFTQWRFGEPFSFLTAQAHWRDHIAVAAPFGALLRDLGRWRAWADHHLPLTLIGLWLGIRVVRGSDRRHALFVAPAMLLSLSLSKLAITPRLHLVLFPLWIEGAVVFCRLPRWLRWSLAPLGMLLGVWLAFSFSRGVWVD